MRHFDYDTSDAESHCHVLRNSCSTPGPQQPEGAKSKPTSAVRTIQYACKKCHKAPVFANISAAQRHAIGSGHRERFKNLDADAISRFGKIESPMGMGGPTLLQGTQIQYRSHDMEVEGDMGVAATPVIESQPSLLELFEDDPESDPEANYRSQHDSGRGLEVWDPIFNAEDSGAESSDLDCGMISVLSVLDYPLSNAASRKQYTHLGIHGLFHLRV